MPLRDLAFRIVLLKLVAGILVLAIAGYVFASIRGEKRRREPRGFEVKRVGEKPADKKERDNDHG